MENTIVRTYGNRKAQLQIVLAVYSPVLVCLFPLPLVLLDALAPNINVNKEKYITELACLKIQIYQNFC